MKNLILSLLAASIIFSSCNGTSQASASAATTTANPADAPIMKFEKAIHDFGKLKVGNKISYDYKFTNTGKTPLIITDGMASCGCTKPEWPKTPIKPGESGIIRVTFNSQGKGPGLQDKLITMTANTLPAQTFVHLIGELTAK